MNHHRESDIENVNSSCVKTKYANTASHTQTTGNSWESMTVLKSFMNTSPKIINLWCISHFQNSTEQIM